MESRSDDSYLETILDTYSDPDWEQSKAYQIEWTRSLRSLSVILNRANRNRLKSDAGDLNHMKGSKRKMVDGESTDTWTSKKSKVSSPI